MDRRVRPEGTGSRPWYTDDERVVHLNTHESAGGAARAARTLHEALVGAGVERRMVVRDRMAEDPRDGVQLIDGLPEEFRRRTGRNHGARIVDGGPRGERFADTLRVFRDREGRAFR
jgi:hypothetical protein